MSKKRNNKRSARNKTSPTALSPTELDNAAQEAMQRGRYRDAIGHFKALMKKAPQAKWREGLAQAYAGRADALAEKGMLKEALVMWENRHQLGADAPLHPAHTALLLRLGHIQEAVDLYNRASDSLPPKALAGVRNQLAAYCLCGDTQIVAGLPPEDPVVIHSNAARTALAAYCDGDDETLEQALAAIPFRSPYRDGVHILKALQCLHNHSTQASALLAKVSSESAFAPLRQAAELALAPEHELAPRLADADKATRDFALPLRGWDAQRLALFEETRKLGDTPSPKPLLHFMYRHRDRLGDDWVRERGRRLLIEEAPRSLDWPVGAGGSPLQEIDVAQINAWQLERYHGDDWRTFDSWERLAQLLEISAPPTPGSDQALRIALVLRRFDQHADILAHARPPSPTDSLDHEVAELVEKSLELDPEEPQAYLRLIGYYLSGKQLKDARRLLNPALKRWPQNIAVLTAALDIAVAGGAFKKAAGFARRILAIDPINRTARERLVKAHLAHARKQLRSQRPDLARQELEQAHHWDTSERFPAQLDSVDALITMATDAQAGAAALQALNQRLGDSLNGRLTLALEAAAVGKNPQALFTDLGLAKPKAQDPDDLKAFLAQLSEHQDSGVRLASEVKSYFEKALKAAARLALSFQAMENACETLRRCCWHTSRQAFAQAALKQWKNAPAFAYHAFEAKYKDAPWKASTTEIRRLERALDKADEQGDTRNAQRIMKLLDRLLPPSPFRGSPAPLEPPFPEEGEALDASALPMLIAIMGLDKALDMMGADNEMKRELKRVEQELGRQGVIEILNEIMSGDPDDGLPPPPAQKPKRPSAPKRRAGRKRVAGDDDTAADADNPFNQPDLF